MSESLQTEQQPPTSESLARAIAQRHQDLQAKAQRAINIGLTLRNWLIGRHIFDYELVGSDRAQYGDRLFHRLAQRLQALHIPGGGRREFYHYRDFFKVCPQIVGTLSPQWQGLPGNVITRSKASVTVVLRGAIS